jgi:hypothetical protein
MALSTGIPFYRRCTPSKLIYGAVTTGTDWKFLKLEDNTAWIDLSNDYIKEIDTILSILAST